MKKALLMLAAVIGLAYFFLPVMRPPADEPSLRGQDMPWRIVPTGDGSITVFGLTLGQSTLNDAVVKLGRRYELGLFRAPGGPIALEAYFRDTVVGGLNAKLVVTGDLDQETLAAMLERGPPGKNLPDGTEKRPLSEADTATALTAPIGSITFAPYVQLDEALVLKRFGQPDERIQVEGDTHWLYAQSGLDLIIDPRGRGILQYLPPRDFQRLRAPLLNHSLSK
jgi:hypothetical protein